MAAAFLTLPCAAQSPDARWRIVEIEPLSDGSTRAHGLNEYGHVVGVETLSNGSTRAFIWILPSTSPHIERYGIAPPYAGGPVSQRHYLNDLTGHTDDNTATDVNDAGVVVGYVGPSGSTQAAIWRLCEQAYAHDCPGTDSERVHFDPDEALGEALSVNQALQPSVVGWRKSENFCNGNPKAPLDRGFLAQFTVDPLELLNFDELEVESASDPASTQAFDVNDVGRSTGNVGAGVPCVPLPGVDCMGYQRGATWDGTTGTPLADYFVSPQRAEEGRGVNNASDIVGWGYYAQGVTSCREAALLWVGAAVTDLHECWTGNESRAESINGDSRIVGFDPAGTALRWTPDQGQSCGYLIENLDDGASCGAVDVLWDQQEAAGGTRDGPVRDNPTLVANTERLGQIRIVDIDDLIQVFLDWTYPLQCAITDACLGDVDYWVDFVLYLFDSDAIDAVYAAELLQAGLFGGGSDGL